MTATLLGAALYYAEQGLRVFPLSPGSKIPYRGSNGCLDASGNAEIIADWWERDPDSNIGIATGHLVDVVDYDGFEGQRSRAQHWDLTFGLIEAGNLGKVLTPRPGGMHLYIRATGRGNRANIAPKVDFRGLGGFAVAPPSVLDPYVGCPNGGNYRWLGIPDFHRTRTEESA